MKDVRLLGLLAGLALCGCTGDPALDVTACDLLTTPTKYDGVVVSVTGFANTSRHGTVLHDTACSDYAIGIEANSKDVDLHPFYDAVSNTYVPDMPDMQVTLVGRFKFYPAAYPGHMLFVTKIVALPQPEPASGG